MARLLCIGILMSILVACNPANNESSSNESNELPANSAGENSTSNEASSNEPAAVARPTDAAADLPTAAFDLVSRSSTEGGTGTAGTILYALDSRIYRISDGGESEDVTPLLDLLGPLPPEGSDRFFNVSPDGNWIILESERFDPECNGWACLSVIPADFSSAEAVRAAGEIVHSWGGPVIASGGNLIVYAGTGGPHEVDLFALNRVQGGWNPPVLLTGNSPFNYHDLPSISDDGQQVVFECGNEPYSAPGTAICEALTDGSEFRVLLQPEEGQNATTEDALSHPVYDPAGGIVFEASWGGTDFIWRLAAAGAAPQLITAAFENDIAPCVLPDGDIITFWLGREGSQGLHELKRMTADGANYTMLVIEQDIIPSGVVCSA